MAVAPRLTFKGGAVEVVSQDIESLTLVTPLPFAARIYIGPWLVLYPLAAYAFYGNYDKYIQSIGAPGLFPPQSAAAALTSTPVTCHHSQNGRSCYASASSVATRSASSGLAGASRSGVGERRDT